MVECKKTMIEGPTVSWSLIVEVGSEDRAPHESADAMGTLSIKGGRAEGEVDRYNRD